MIPCAWARCPAAPGAAARLSKEPAFARRLRLKCACRANKWWPCELNERAVVKSSKARRAQLRALGALIPIEVNPENLLGRHCGRQACSAQRRTSHLLIGPPEPER